MTKIIFMVAVKKFSFSAFNLPALVADKFDMRQNVLTGHDIELSLRLVILLYSNVAAYIPLLGIDIRNYLRELGNAHIATRKLHSQDYNNNGDDNSNNNNNNNDNDFTVMQIHFRLQNLYSGFQCPVFRIPQANISRISKSGLPLQASTAHGCMLLSSIFTIR